MARTNAPAVVGTVNIQHNIQHKCIYSYEGGGVVIAITFYKNNGNTRKCIQFKTSIFYNCSDTLIKGK